MQNFIISYKFFLIYIIFISTKARVKDRVIILNIKIIFTNTLSNSLILAKVCKIFLYK